MTPPQSLISVLLLIALVFPGVTHAQETNTGSTATGATLEEEQAAREEQLRWEAKERRTDGFWVQMMNRRAAVSDYRKKSALRRDKRQEQRLACRKDVRQANRDTLQSEMFRCFRSMLTLDLEELRKQKQHLEDVVGAPEEVINEAIFYIDDLMDAINVVIDAIDAGVYESAEDLQEAKRNLGTHYRQPMRLAVNAVRIEQLLTWLDHLALRLKTLVESEETYEEPANMLNNAIECLEEQSLATEGLRALESNEEVIAGIRGVKTGVATCLATIQEAHLLNKEIDQANQETEEAGAPDEYRRPRNR